MEGVGEAGFTLHENWLSGPNPAAFGLKLSLGGAPAALSVFEQRRANKQPDSLAKIWHGRFAVSPPA